MGLLLRGRWPRKRRAADHRLRAIQEPRPRPPALADDRSRGKHRLAQRQGHALDYRAGGGGFGSVTNVNAAQPPTLLRQRPSSVSVRFTIVKSYRSSSCVASPLICIDESTRRRLTGGWGRKVDILGWATVKLPTFSTM